MATKLGQITVNGILVISCDSDPSTGIGLVAPVGSFASTSDGSGLFYKSTSSNTGWSILITSPMTSIGDMIYGDSSGIATRLGGNTTSIQKFLSQTGDGVDSSAPSWQTIPTAGLAAYFFYKIASDIPTYYQEKVSASLGATQTFTTLVGAGTDTLIASFATNVGFPNITFMPSGVFTVFFSANKDVAAAKTTQLFARFYQRTSGGVETLIGTSSITPAITNVIGSYIVQGVVPSALVLLSTDRLVTKIYVRGSVTGGATNCILTIEDDTAARIEVPSVEVNSTNFVPYSGATADVDLGTYSLSTGGNMSLSVAGGGLYIKEGSNATMGISTLIGGTVTVSNTKVTANSRIFLSINSVGVLANIGIIYEDKANRIVGTSFIIKSSNVLDTSNISWVIIEPA